MCCFSRPVPYVAGTRIFARALDDARQALVYSMSFGATDAELAMILPLPVPPSPAEDAVSFVSLEGYDRIFTDMERAFGVPLVEMTRSTRSRSVQAVPTLIVHDVGDFEASFVPAQADFDRLDPRFRIAPEVWAQLPQYADWGFAVFKLKQKPRGLWARLTGRGPEKQTVHPMAFVFPVRDPGSLFFPTVHIHDGEVHAEARFDHTLYCQPGPVAGATRNWDRSETALGEHVDPVRSRGLIDPDALCFRTTLRGVLPNRDQILTAAA
jgi:hypothetical protein